MATETKNKVLGVKLNQYLMQRALINENIEGNSRPVSSCLRKWTQDYYGFYGFNRWNAKKKILIIIKRRRNISLIKFANYAGKMPVGGDI